MHKLMGASYLTAPNGRMLHVNDPDRPEAPRMALCACPQGAIVLYRHDATDLREHLTLAAPIAPHNIEFHHILPHDTRWNDPSVVAQGTPEGDALWARWQRDGLPPGIVSQGFTDLSHFWPPWCVAMAGEEIASIAFAARIDAAAACIGVATVPVFRGRGFACAVTAAWSALPALRDRVLFYSTHFDNAASQRVIAKLALPRLGVGLTLP